MKNSEKSAEQQLICVGTERVLELRRTHVEQKHRTPDAEIAFSAIKFAHYAPLSYPEKYFILLRHKLTSPHHQEHGHLFWADADELINQTKAHPTNPAERFLLESLRIL